MVEAKMGEILPEKEKLMHELHAWSTITVHLSPALLLPLGRQHCFILHRLMRVATMALSVWPGDWTHLYNCKVYKSPFDISVLKDAART
jgi:hypothetical protein